MTENTGISSGKLPTLPVLDSLSPLKQVAGSPRNTTRDKRALKHIATRSRDPRRFGVVALALLQFAVFASFPVADAILEARGVSDTVHIERESSEQCDTGHNHLLCQLTRGLSSGIPAQLLIDYRPATEASRLPPSVTTRENRPVLPGGNGPRAPPRA